MPRQHRLLEVLTAGAHTTPDAGTVRHDPLALVTHLNQVQERLVDLLEAVADALPDRVTCEAAGVSALFLRHSMAPQIDLEEAILLPFSWRTAAATEPSMRTQKRTSARPTGNGP